MIVHEKQIKHQYIKCFLATVTLIFFILKFSVKQCLQNCLLGDVRIITIVILLFLFNKVFRFQRFQHETFRSNT